MSYISHEDYKDLMSKFQAGSPKSILKEAVEEGNAFTAALAKTPKGGKAKVDGQEITDTSSYDDSTVRESSDEVDSKLERIADLHKGKKIDFETIEKIAKGLEAQGHEVNVRYIQQYLSQHGVEINEYGYADKYPGSWEEGKEHRSVTGRGMREGLRMPPLQATGQTIDTVEENSAIDAPFGVVNPGTKKQLEGPGLQLNNLTTEEKKQLGEFVDAVKTTKKAIEELLKKASGKNVKVKEDMGGNRTDLVMTPSTVSEGKVDSESYKSVENHLDTELHGAFETAVGSIIKNLKAEGIEEDLIEMFLKHEIEEKTREATMGQHDLGEGSYKVSKNAVPARNLKSGDIVSNGKEEIVSVSAGARTPSGKVDVVLKNIATGVERSVQWGSSTMVSKRPK